MVPREEREDVVRAISNRVVETYGKSIRREESFGLRVVSPPVQHDGYIEHRETTYVPSLSADSASGLGDRTQQVRRA